MALQAAITIAGLGPGAPGDITLTVWEALRSSPCTFLRTGKHPAVSRLVKEGIKFSTFDCFYEQSSSFEEVYAQIAEAVMAAACPGPVLYAVPGHPLVAEESVRLIIEAAKREGISVDLLPAVSFLDAVFSALRLDPGMGLQVIDGLRLDTAKLETAKPAIIMQVYSRLVAADVKVSLLELYPPGHRVTVVRGAGIPGEERIEVIPLFELDRLEWVDHLTSLYIPESGIRLPGAGNQEGETYRRAPGIRRRQKNRSGAGDRQPGRQLPATGSCFPLDPLVELLAKLRGEGGCPWDREQDHLSLRPYLLEETYEVLEALNKEDMYKLCEELGDLLLQIVFHAQIAAESRHFDINDVIKGITEKITRRHPHVFGSVTVRDSDEVALNWKKIKAEERGDSKPASLLDGVPMSLPALIRAAKIQQKAAEAGFDWPDYRGAREKIGEELGELETAISGGDAAKVEEELGDLIFSVVNLARLLNVEPEVALAATCEKFTGRFAYVEKMARLNGKELSQCSLADLDTWWEKAKEKEILGK